MSPDSQNPATTAEQVEKAYQEELDAYSGYADAEKWDKDPVGQAQSVRKKAVEIAMSMLKDGPKAALADAILGSYSSLTAPLAAAAKSGIEVKTNDGHSLAMNDRGCDIKLSTVFGHSVSMIDVPLSKAAGLPGEYAKSKAKKKKLNLKESLATGIFVSTWWGHAFNLNDLEQKCELVSKGEHAVRIKDIGSVLELSLKDGHAVVLDGGGQSITIKSKSGHVIRIDDKQNSITVEGKSGKNKLVIHDDADQIEVETKSGGSLMLCAPDGVMKLKAKDIEIAADNEVSITAKKITSEAGVAHSIKGKTVKSEATGVNTVKGTIVQLNP